jgi:hypothetical protein
MNKIHLCIVEDMAVDRFSYQSELELCGVKCRIEPHELFASGDWDRQGSTQRKRIRVDDGEKFEIAIRLLRDYKGMGVFVFDYHLNGCELMEKDLNDYLAQCTHVARNSDKMKILDFFNDHRQGLFLALILATNKDADADIWLATGANLGVDRDIEQLKGIKNDKITVANLNVSLGRSQDSDEVRSHRIQSMLTKFQERRNLDDPGFWPGSENDREEWFRSSQSVVPHEKPPVPPTDLVNYLENLGLDKTIALKWLRCNPCYEALKCFIGSCSRSDSDSTSGKAPSLGCLPFILVRAVGKLEWADKIDWNDVFPTPVYQSGRFQTRCFIVLLYKLFKVLREDGSKDLQIVAEFKKMSDGVHFLVDFGPNFDCVVGRDASRASLLARIMKFCFGPPGDGQVTKAIYQWLMSSRTNNAPDSLFFAIYPIEKNSEMWTRLDFKARG